MLEFVALAQECAPSVAPQTMAAIVKTESQFRPLAIGVNGGARLIRQPATREEAVVTAKRLISNGYNIDLGLGQVNSANLAKTGLSVEDAFDPCKNLAAAAWILHANYQTARAQIPDDQRALHAAFSIYNTGSMTKGFTNGYVQKVVANAGALQGTPVPAVQPIPLASGKTLLKPPQPPKVKPRQQPGKFTDPVRLTAEGEPAPARRNPSVYQSSDVQNVMVYR
jgi:type IV secretion system protein VirB1